MPYIYIYIIYVSSCIPLSIYIYIYTVYTNKIYSLHHTYCSICIPKYLNCGMMFWDEFYPFIDYFARGITVGPWHVSWAVTVGRTRYKLGHLGERNRDWLVNITPKLLWFMIRVTDSNCSIHGVKLHQLIAGGPTLYGLNRIVSFYQIRFPKWEQLVQLVPKKSTKSVMRFQPPSKIDPVIDGILYINGIYIYVL